MADGSAGRCIEINRRRLCLVQGDITEQASDAIVNAANCHLQLGAGVAGAIRSKGGPLIQEECDRIGGTPVGTAVLTSGGRLKAKAVIHAVGPRMGEGDEEVKLAAAARAALQVADQHGLGSISLPAISTGIFGFPIEAAARIMLREAGRQLLTDTTLQEITFCLFNGDDYAVFDAELLRQQSEPATWWEGGA